MSTRNNILETLKEELEDYIVPTRGYHTDIVEVKRGIHFFEDFNMKPAASFWCTNDSVEEEFDTEDARTLNIRLDGFADTHLADFTTLHNFLNDIEYFLQNDFTHKDNTLLGEINIYEGGEQESIGHFYIDFQIVYDYDSTNR